MLINVFINIALIGHSDAFIRCDHSKFCVCIRNTFTDHVFYIHCTGKATLNSEDTSKGTLKIDTIPEESLKEKEKEDIDGEGDEKKGREGGEVSMEGGDEGDSREGGLVASGEGGAPQIQVNLEHWESHRRSKCVWSHGVMVQMIGRLSLMYQWPDVQQQSCDAEV